MMKIHPGMIGNTSPNRPMNSSPKPVNIRSSFRTCSLQYKVRKLEPSGTSREGTFFAVSGLDAERRKL